MRKGVRIIGGRWRGRILAAPPGRVTRPTPDRVRETVFNWLAGAIDGRMCLDLFAGTGALGLEAVSRGAAGAVLVEKNAAVHRLLVGNVQSLDAGNVEVVRGDGLRYLARCRHRFDLVFVDPPFGIDDLYRRVLDGMVDFEVLNDGALVYIESRSTAPRLPPYPGFNPLKSLVQGDVRAELFKRHDPPEAVTRTGIHK